MTKIWDQMEKLYGTSGSGKMGLVEVITSGSLALDESLGVWGLPKGRIIQYAGKESSGKTLMSLIAIREWQKLNPENWAVFIDAEYTYNENWASKLGVDNDRVFLIKENDGVKIFTQLCGVPNKEIGKKKSKPGILDMELENPSGLGIIVFDSIAAMQTPIELTKAVGNTNIAPMGRFLPDALKRITPLLSQTGVTFIAINQVRVDVGKMYGDPTSTPGGKAWKHACSVMIHFTMADSKKAWFLNDSGKRYGHIAGAKIDKNKVACPGTKCIFELEYEIGVVRGYKEICELALKYNVVERPNNVMYNYGEYKWKGEDRYFKGVFESDLSNELLAKVKEAKEKGVVPVDFKEKEDVELFGDLEDVDSDE
jgi:recombination protein RecA